MCFLVYFNLVKLYFKSFYKILHLSFIPLLDYYVMLYFCDTLIHIMCNLITSTLYHTYIDFTWINLSIYLIPQNILL